MRAAITLFVVVAGMAVVAVTSTNLWGGAVVNAWVAATVCAIVLTTLYLRRDSAWHKVSAELQSLQDLCATDLLTGLLNRTAFIEQLGAMSRSQEARVAVIFFDLNRFKEVNDTFGHRIGDRLLVEIADRARSILPENGLLARLSGDEYAVALPLSPTQNPLDHGLQLHRTICEPATLDGICVRVGSSMGIAIGPAEIDAMTLLQRADFAMYDAKRTRSACRIYDDDLDQRHRIEAQIRQEISSPDWLEELSMLFQPIIDIKTGKTASFEALLRWNSPRIGTVSPTVLIPIAEDYGHIEQVTEWTLERAMNAARTFDVRVAVNISPVYFRHPEFVQRIFDRLVEHDVHPDLLTLELTEGVLIEDLQRATEIIARLRDAGIRVVLDDFGTGFSSLSYLQHFSLDGIKLDKSFLRDIGGKSQATKIIKTMVDFGHSLDMSVVIEGVENEWQYRLLQLIGCDYAQGFAIGTPMELTSDTTKELGVPASTQPKSSTNFQRAG